MGLRISLNQYADFKIAITNSGGGAGIVYYNDKTVGNGKWGIVFLNLAVTPPVIIEVGSGVSGATMPATFAADFPGAIALSENVNFGAVGFALT